MEGGGAWLRGREKAVIGLNPNSTCILSADKAGHFSQSTATSQGSINLLLPLDTRLVTKPTYMSHQHLNVGNTAICCQCGLLVHHN